MYKRNFLTKLKNKKALLVLSQKIHKWLMIWLGLQFAIWSITGFYMVVVDLDYIHGDSLVNIDQSPLNINEINYSINNLYQDYANAENISLASLNTHFYQQLVYRFTVDNKPMMLAADSGKLLSPITKSQAELIAKAQYTGAGEIINSAYIAENAPFELNPRYLPVWQIKFNDFANPILYVSADTGKIVTKRHQFWRIFDWMFRFHIMDYSAEESVDNQLLFWVTLLAIIAAIAGLILTIFNVILPSIHQRFLFNVENK